MRSILQMEEIWKSIPGYEGIYEVSNEGRVRVLPRIVYQPKTKHGFGVFRKFGLKELSAIDNGKGYSYVTLVKDGVRKNHYVHRLVVEAFVGDPHGLEINHIDYNKSNNHATNLEIVTRNQNVQHSIKHMTGPKRSRDPKFYCIHKRKGENKYEVCVFKRYLGKFENLEDAIKRRDEYLDEIDYTGRR